MTVQELILQLEKMPPLMSVYLQASPTGLNPTICVTKDDNLGIVELHYEK